MSIDYINTLLLLRAESYTFNANTTVGRLATRIQETMPSLMAYKPEAGPAKLAWMRPHPYDVSQQRCEVSQGWADLADTLLKVL